MAGLLSLVVLVLSGLILAGIVTMLFLVRRGEGPRFSASRAYDANGRDAMRALLGEEVDRVPRAQWYDPARRRVSADAETFPAYLETVAEALEAVVPDDRGLAFDPEGHAHLAAENVWVLPALSTADLRAEGLKPWDARGRLIVGLVLFNPEPPGGEATRVALPIQVLFPALEGAGRHDLIQRFEALSGRPRG
ncbi:MAG: hypothetical protein ABR559_05915 [Gemmatimonadota bacterium]